jgi:hypothetical protein
MGKILVSFAKRLRPFQAGAGDRYCGAASVPKRKQFLGMRNCAIGGWKRRGIGARQRTDADKIGNGLFGRSDGG